jgi:uncharacterized protein
LNIGPLGLAEATAAAMAAGAINAISGGGTLITFPILIGLGLPSISANATSTVALWPGVLGSLWGYRKELKGAQQWALMMAGPCLLGGIIGSVLLLHTRPKVFDLLAPVLVLAATILFMGHAAIGRMARGKAREGDAPPEEPKLTPGRTIIYLLFQLGVAVYGGYFGAGIGILMLAALGMMGQLNIHRMNGLKAFGAFCINGVAVLIFATHGIVDWPVALTMAAGSIVGGYAGARMARHVGQVVVRRAIIVLGFTATLALLVPHILARFG